MKSVLKYTAAGVACITPFSLTTGGAIWLLDNNPMVLQTVGMVAIGAAGVVLGYFLAAAVVE